MSLGRIRRQKAIHHAEHKLSQPLSPLNDNKMYRMCPCFPCMLNTDGCPNSMRVELIGMDAYHLFLILPKLEADSL